ncbi:MAG: PQQ-dependent sugar dehydrogenase [SAR324 cluster bacterium]|nr:PQQ-dependent sugar dehydrogenase [SAR324 cluster bacterium]MBL7035792.1 PQQ-dependent sugar dehydrogenase [SAR324 cluster bacterium]
MSFTCWVVFQENRLQSPCGTIAVKQNNFVRQLAKFLGLLLAFCWLNQSVMAETLLLKSSKGVPFQLNKVADGLGVPWGMVFIGPDQILFTERNGKIGILDTVSGVITRITGGPKVMYSGQGGLLDVAVPPGYSQGDWIYFTYSKELQGKGVTTLARTRLKGKRLVTFQDMLITRSASTTGRHFGSRITFDGTGHLFFSVGDRGVRPNGQDLSTHAGSILRLTVDGSVPENNPFVQQKNALPEIWSYGHRNPQGIFYDRKKRRLWSIEHGPRGGDEINLILPGRNYGWPVISYGKEYWGPVQVGEGTKKEGMEQPVKFYIPSIAPGSLIVYSGKAFPDWKGNLFAGALKLTHLNRVEIDNSGRAVAEERLLEGLGERIRALLESPQGWLYFSTDSGRIFRLRPLENNQ